jgi:hypothetical protein
MASLLDLAQARLQGLLDIPTRAARAIVNPTAFSGLLGAPTLPQQQGFAEGFAQLPPQQNMSVLDPAQESYMQGYSAGEPYGLLASVAPFTKGMPVGASIKDVSYRGSHSAPNAATYGATLDKLDALIPKDIYSQQGKRLYGIGDPKIDSEWYIAALRTKGKPDAEVEVFRAVPKGVKDINSGDWVTTSPTYAKWHGENVLGGDYELISKKVKANTLSTEGYPYEFGYNFE